MAEIPFGLYNDATEVRVSPLVPSIILDYYTKNANSKYIIGTILGTFEGDKVEITNCYGVPFERVEHVSGRPTYTFNEDYDQKMRTLLTRNTKEDVLGMFFVKV